PHSKRYSKRHVESVEQLIRMINEVLEMAPEFGSQSSMVATPLGAILDWSMGTPAGFAAFRDPRINAMLKKILTAWCEFLSSGDLQPHDRFWIKNQPYSLADMLGDDESVGEFIGGTVYQAFLSATNYHRWHSPVAGKIVRAFVREGTYYSEAESEGKDAVEPT